MEDENMETNIEERNSVEISVSSSGSLPLRKGYRK